MSNSLAYEVYRLSGEQIELCYHCHKCTAGCPVVDAMEYGPDRLLRMALLEQHEPIFLSRDIWLCVGCYTCAARCPNEINIAAVMDGLRQMALEGGYRAQERDVLLFHRLFLGAVKTLGRSHELVVLGLFKVLSHVPLLNDMEAGLGLFRRGKVPVLPQTLSPAAGVRRLFKRSKP